MKTRQLVIGLFGILCFVLINGLNAQTNTDLARRMFVKTAQESLSREPNGEKIGSLLKGCIAQVIAEQDDWALVQVVAWVPKASLAHTKPDLLKGEFHALHIVVKTRDEAEIILRQLKSGKKSFADLAKERSISSSAAKGGDLGYFNKGDFPAEIESVIVKLKINEISSVLETQFGFNIFKRIE